MTKKIENKKIDLKSFWVKIWKLLKPSRKQIEGVLLLLFALEIVKLIGPYILKIIIDKITDLQTAQIEVVLLLIVAMFLVNQFANLIDYFSDKQILSVLADALYYLSNNAHKKMVFLSLGYHERENTGNKIVKISRGIDKIDNLFGNFFWEVAPTIFQIFLTVGILFWANWIFGVIAIIFIPVFVYLTLKVNKKVYPLRRRRFDYQEEAAGVMAQSIININTVKSFVQELREYRKFSGMTQKVKDNVSLEFKSILKYNMARNLIIDLGR